MDFIEKSVITFDIKEMPPSSLSTYIISDTYYSDPPKNIFITFNCKFNELQYDDIYVFNSLFVSNKNKYQKTYMFRLSYNSQESITDIYLFSSKYKYNYVNYGDGLSKVWSISYLNHDADDGIFKFDSTYKYVLDESKYTFNCLYTHRFKDDHILFNNPFLVGPNNTTAFHMQIEESDGIINFEEVFKYAIKNYNLNNDLLAENINGHTIVSIDAIGNYLYENKKVIGLTINNGSRYSNVTIPVMWDNEHNKFCMPPLYSSSVHIDYSNISIDGDNFKDTGKYEWIFFNVQPIVKFYIPSFTIYNIDPYRPTSIKISVIELSDNDNLYVDK